MGSSAKTGHPDSKQLAAFAQGRLPPAESLSLRAHLDGCAPCRQELARLPGGADSLSGADTLPPAGTPKAVRPAARTFHDSGGDLPAGLADHPRYEVLQLLGRGGMGAVYQARHRKMDRLVALKVINAQLVGNETTVARFHREVQAAAKLDHPNIVRALDADQAGDTHFLVMEFVEGTDLARYVERKGPLPVPHACHFVRQAALGLQHAHERGMVHRDIKPHNLMLTPQGVVKVMDFGLARLGREGGADGGLTGENVLMGTADYIAPEQAEDAHQADIRADVYSLGCTLYHLLAGRAPFAGGTVVQKVMAHATTAVPLAGLPAAVPGELRAVLARMVEKNPAERYQTPGEVAQALAPFVKKATGVKPAPAGAGGVTIKRAPTAVGVPNRQQETTATRAAAPAKRGGNGKPRRGWLVPAVVGTAVLAVSLVTVVVLLPGRGSRSPAKSVPVTDAGAPPRQKQPAALPAMYTNRLGMEFVLVPRGKFLMGGGGGTVGGKEVVVPDDFYLGKYEVTQGEWQKVTGLNPSHFSRTGGRIPGRPDPPGQEMVKDIGDEELKRFPVENVSWEAARLFLEVLNAQEKEAGWLYRLPKEAEWEYACRGGPTSNPFDYAYDFYLDEPRNRLSSKQANIWQSDGHWLRRTCKVGSYQPNRLGLYDMHGNVCEWCDDAQKTGDGSPGRVIRGGCWHYASADNRAVRRSVDPPSFRLFDLGLRVARVPVAKEKTVTTASGLKYEDLKVGDGREAKTGDRVAVHYTGRLTDGTKFDSSLDRNEPFVFKLGEGQVIKGWDEGIAGMKAGGKRKLFVPAQLAYGTRGAGKAGEIPPNADLVFDIELLEVR